MRVLHVSCFRDPEDRGPDALLSEWGTLTGVAAGVRDAGAAVAVVQAAAADAEVESEGVRVHFVREPHPPGVRWILPRATPLPFRISRMIARLRPELLHFHGLSFPVHTIFLANRFPSVPFVLQDHADTPLAGWRKRAQRRAFGTAAAVTFTARDQAKSFQEAGIMDSDQTVHEVPEGSSRFTPGDAAEARHHSGMGGDPAILWVGDLSEGKDPITALGAIARAAARLPGIQVWCIYRKAPLLDAVRARVAGDAALRDRVRLVGPVAAPEVEEWVRGADYLLSSSLHEGSGYAAIEAMACGTPPVLSDIPSFRRLTDDGGVGALFPVCDPVAGGNALVEMALGDRYGQRRRAREWFESQLSFRAIGQRLVSVYEEVLAS